MTTTTGVTAVGGPRAISARRPRRPSLQRKQSSAGYLLVAPTVVVFGLFTIYPLITAVRYSFLRVSIFGRTDFVGLDNFRSVLSNRATLTALGVTLTFTLLYVVVGTAVAILFAGTLWSLGSRLRSVLRIALYFPSMVPIVATSVVWRWMYNDAFGILNRLTGALGLPREDWLGDRHLALYSVSTMTIATGLGASIFILVAAFEAVTRDLQEAALLDGASIRGVFVHIVLPLSRPAVLYLVVVQTIGAVQMFAPFSLMTGGGPAGATTTLGYLAYQDAFERFDLGRASALSVLMSLIMIALALSVFRLLRPKEA